MESLASTTSLPSDETLMTPARPTNLDEERNPAEILKTSARLTSPGNPDEPHSDPKVLLLTLEEGSKMNPFQVVKALSKFGSPTRVFRYSPTTLEVVMTSEKETSDLLGTKQLSFPGKSGCEVSIPVSVRLHPTKNFALGVITCQELAGTPDEDICSGLESQNVLKVKRISKRLNGEKVPTNTIILTFKTKVLPEKIRIGWMSVRVRQYVADPLRCYHCQRYGHLAKVCKGKETCPKCSEEGHSSSACQAESAKCASCKGDHEVWSRTCPKFLSEREKLKARDQEKASRLSGHPLKGSQSALYPKDNHRVSNILDSRPKTYRDALASDLRGASSKGKVSLDSPIQDVIDITVRDILRLINVPIPCSSTRVEGASGGSPRRGSGTNCVDRGAQTEPAARSDSDTVSNSMTCDKGIQTEPQTVEQLHGELSKKHGSERSASAPPKDRSAQAGNTPLLPTPVVDDVGLMPPPYPPPPPPSLTPPSARAESSESSTPKEKGSNKAGKRRCPSPHRDSQNAQPQQKKKQQNPGFVFRDKRGKESVVPRVQKEIPRTPHFSYGSTESIGTVQHVWQDAPRPTPASDGRRPGPRVSEAYMENDPTFVRRSPPKYNGLGHMKRTPQEWNAMTAWCVSEMFDGRSWET